MIAAAEERLQEFEAPEVALALVHNAALRLGASPELAAEAARTGIFELQSRRVVVAVSPDEDTLLLTTDLAKAWGSDPVLRTQSLRSSIAMFLQAGVTFCQTIAGPALIARWPLAHPDADLLAAWIRDFARMSDALDRGVSTKPIANTEEF